LLLLPILLPLNLLLPASLLLLLLLLNSQDMAQAVCKSAASSFWNSSSSSNGSTLQSPDIKPPDISDIPTPAEAVLGCFQALNPLSAALLATQGLSLRVLIDRLAAAAPEDPLLALGVPEHSMQLLAAQFKAEHLRLEPSPERSNTSSRRQGMQKQQQGGYPPDEQAWQQQQQAMDAAGLLHQQQQLQQQQLWKQEQQQQQQQRREQAWQQPKQLAQQQQYPAEQQEMLAKQQQQQHGYADEQVWQQRQQLAQQQELQLQQQSLAEQQALLADDDDDLLLSRMQHMQQQQQRHLQQQQQFGARAGYAPDAPDMLLADDEFCGAEGVRFPQQQQQQRQTAARQQMCTQMQQHYQQQQQQQAAAWGDDDEDLLEQQQLWAGQHQQQQQQRGGDVPIHDSGGIDPSGVLDAFLSHRGGAAAVPPAAFRACGAGAAAHVGGKRARQAAADGWGSAMRQNHSRGSVLRAQQQQGLAAGALDGHCGRSTAAAAAAGPVGINVMMDDDGLGGDALPFAAGDHSAADYAAQGLLPHQQQHQQQRSALRSARSHMVQQNYDYIDDGGFEGGGGMLHGGPPDGFDQQQEIAGPFAGSNTASRRASAAALFGNQQQQRRRAPAATGARQPPRDSSWGAADMFGVSSSRPVRAGLGNSGEQGLVMGGLSPSLGYPDQGFAGAGGPAGPSAGADEFGFGGFEDDLEAPVAAAHGSAVHGVEGRATAAAAAAVGGTVAAAARTSSSSSLLVGAFMPHRKPTKQLRYQKPVGGAGVGGRKAGRGKGKQQSKLHWG
jgi:hypothetical protein